MLKDAASVITIILFVKCTSPELNRLHKMSKTIRYV